MAPHDDARLRKILWTGDVSQAAALVTRCLKEMPGRQEYLDFAVKVGAELPSRAREISAERARVAKHAGTT
jgi:hypothetical protein